VIAGRRRGSALARYAADLATLPGDAAIGYRNEGMRGVWGAVACRTVHRVIRTSRLTVFAQPLEHLPEVAPPAGVTISRLRSDEVEALAPIAGERDRERFRGLLGLGCVGLVAWKAGRPVGYAWIAREMRPEVSLYPLDLPRHAAYLWDLYVVPAERCGGLGSALAAERLRTAGELGFTEGWRMVAPDNVASLRTLRRTGLQPRVVGEVRCLKLGPRLFGGFTPCPPPTR
jgi:ribosomal protein S18 acetylase RimI-like enzyme